MNYWKRLFSKILGEPPPLVRPGSMADLPPPLPEHLRGIKGIKYSPAFDLDRPILKLGNGAGKEAIFASEILQNTLITGDTGTGKSTSSARQLALGLLHNKWAGCVLTVKQEDVGLWRKYAAEAGRSHDLVEISLDNERYRFDPIDYEYRRPGGGDTFNMVEILFSGVEVASRMRASQTNERFFTDNAKRHAIHGIDVLKFAHRRVKLTELKKLLDSLPQSIEEKQSKAWRKWSYLWECLEEVDGRLAAGELTEDEADALAEARAYFLEKWPALADGTRGSIAATLDGLLMYLTTDKIKKLTEKTTIIPEMLFNERAIFLCALPTQIYGASGRVYQALFKRSVQDAVMRRDVRRYPRCTFLYVDEAQELMTEHDRKALAVCRSARLAHIFITQNVASMIDELGGDMKAQAAVESMLGNFVIKIGHRTNCKKTRALYVDAIDKHWQMETAINTNASTNNGNGNGNNSSGTSTQRRLEYQLLPSEFGYLRTGSAINHGQVDAILLNGNRTFRNGRNWIKATFLQEGW